MNTIPDDPVIRNTERTGYPDCRGLEYPHCPICGQEAETLYLNKNLQIVGCDNCVCTADAWDEPRCFEEKE